MPDSTQQGLPILVSDLATLGHVSIQSGVGRMADHVKRGKEVQEDGAGVGMEASAMLHGFQCKSQAVQEMSKDVARLMGRVGLGISPREVT